MHQHGSRKRQIATRSFIYGIMTMAVIFAVVICIFVVLGYQFNKTSGRFEQGSLLQFRSFPSGADVLINNQLQGFKTPDKKNVSAGDHTIVMQREGYNAWSKSIHLRPGELMWLNYTRLVPKTIITEPVKEFSALNSALASPNKNWFVFQQTPTDKTFELYELDNERNPEISTLKLPEQSVIPEKTKTAEITEWDSGNKYFLVEYNQKTAPEFVVVDRTDASKAVNLTKKFNIKMDKVHFADTSGKAFFVSSEGSLRKVNLDSGTISEPLVSNVTDFSLRKSNEVVFSAVSDQKRITGTVRSSDEKPIVARSFKGVQPPMLVASSAYFGDDYLATSNGKEVEVIKNPESSKKVIARFILRQPVQWLSFSENGRFIVAQHGIELATHDLEYGTTQHITLSTKKAVTKPAGWMDDYHLWNAYSGQIEMLDFDGSNRQIITDTLPGFDVALSSNGKRLFSIGQDKTTKKPILQSSQMVTEN